MTRDQLKAQYQQYQKLAKIIADTAINIKVSELPNVHMTDEGAFVEASIWIPKSMVKS